MARARGRADVEELEGEPRNDAYTGMLILSLVAMLTGCVLLFLDYSQYEGKAPTPSPIAPPQRPTTTPEAAP